MFFHQPQQFMDQNTDPPPHLTGFLPANNDHLLHQQQQQQQQHYYQQQQQQQGMEQTSWMVSMAYTQYYHDDPAAFAYFQQELLSPRLQATMLKQQQQQLQHNQQRQQHHVQYQLDQSRQDTSLSSSSSRRNVTGGGFLPLQQESSYRQPPLPPLQQQQQQQYLPSIMVPPQSPTLASYYFEGSNGWVSHYYDPNRRYLSPRQQFNLQIHPPPPTEDQQYSHDPIQQQMMMQQQYMAAAQPPPPPPPPSIHHTIPSQQQSNYHHPSFIQQQELAASATTPIQYPVPSYGMTHHHHQQQQQIMDPSGIMLGSSSSSLSSSLSTSSLSHLTQQQQQQQPMSSPRTIATNKLNQLMSSIVSSSSSSSTLTSTSSSIHHQPLVLHPYASAEYREEWRENVLQYAHGLYSQSPQNPLLLTVLHSLHDTFPRHLPTLLLLACVYYTHQEYQQSLRYNYLILKYDPHYVEAMSNIGTTLRSLGRTGEAERWWYQAVQLRPGYWDAVENLVGVLCSPSDKSNNTAAAAAASGAGATAPPPAPSTSSTGPGINEMNDHPMTSPTMDSINEKKNGGDTGNSNHPRYKEALQVCEYVETHFFKSTVTTFPLQVPDELPVHQLPRLQNLFYAKGNLKYALGDVLGARMEYEKGLDLVFGGMGWGSVVYHLALTCSPAMDPSNQIPLILLQPDQAIRISQLAFASTGGVLPGLASKSSKSTSSSSTAAAASTTTTTTTDSNKIAIEQQPPPPHQKNTNTNQASSANIIQQSNQTTSTIMLTLAKLFQDIMNPSTPALVAAAHRLAQREQQQQQTTTAPYYPHVPSLALLLPLYYLSLALHPSPSTANNLGIILSNLPMAVTINAIRLSPSAPPSSSNSSNINTPPPTNLPTMPPLSGTMLAMQYYMYGLQLDPRHPHLYTNLGSLLKDMGHLNEAVAMYEKAVEYNPQFDVALANLGNAVKDMGRVQDSIQWYRRAVQANPDFVDAICGLINALGGVCDWRGRGYVFMIPPQQVKQKHNPAWMNKRKWTIMTMGGGGTLGELEPGMVNDYGQWIPLSTSSLLHFNRNQGWMAKLVSIVEQQLDQGATWGHGLIRQQQYIHSTTIKDWTHVLLDGLIHRMVTLCLKAATVSTSQGYADQVAVWQQRLAYYLNDTGVMDDNNNKKDHATTTMTTTTLCDRNEGGWIVRMVERLTRRLQRQWYVDTFGITTNSSSAATTTTQQPLYTPIRPTAEDCQTFARPLLTYTGGGNNNNNALASTPPVPTVLPFHTFTYPLTARQVRLISHRNALRITQSTLTASWLPSHVYPPPPPPQPRLKVGYVSSDFNNHPLSHLMQSVFGFHDRKHYDVYCYATTPSDQSPYRLKIESGTEHFLDVSQWSNQQVIDRILHDGIHILVNLNGYTKGARNEIFAARPCPVQCSFMGFAGTLGGGWTDYIIADPIVCPPSTVSCDQWRRHQRGTTSHGGGDLEGDVDPESQRQDVVYTEKFIYMPHSYFVNDHKQGFRELDQEQDEKSLATAGDDTVGDDDTGSMVTQHPHAPTNMLANMTMTSEKTLLGGGGPLPSSSASTSTTGSSTSNSSSSNSINSTRSSSSTCTTNNNDEQQQQQHLWEKEEIKRMTMRHQVFPDLPDNVVIFANFNQLYKLEPATFRLWLRILARVPNSILWLLRFPPAGEHHLRQWANDWGTGDVGQRVVFTDVAPKHVHIHRGRVADIFLDTPECNAHTTAADILWSGTPMVTWPKYEHKMCSRVGASIAYATGFGQDMVVHDERVYEDKAVTWANSIHYTFDQVGGSVVKRGHGELMILRKQLFLSRESSRLFDTLRWTRHLEQGYKEAWRRWVLGYEFEDYLPMVGPSMSEHDQSQLAASGCIWIQDQDD